MLKTLFLWLDTHPGSYWVMAVAASAWLLARIWRFVRNDPNDRGPLPGWRDAAALFVFLFAWRWPFLLVAYDYNPDESQMIAGALTLARDPVFWRSVDGGSSGPLNYYLLVPWHWIGAPLDYFTARLTCLLLSAGALFGCLRALAQTFGPRIAWLGVLPGAAVFATSVNPELTNLSTEHVPLLIIAAAASLLSGSSLSRRRLLAAAFVAGSLPWSKLQSAPLASVLVAWAGWAAWRSTPNGSTRRLQTTGGVLLAAAIPTLFVVGLAAAMGVLDAMWQRYILQNFVYVRTGETATIGEAMGHMWLHARNDGGFPLLFSLTGAGLLVATIPLVRKKESPSTLWIVGAALTGLATAVIVAPRREYLHYLLLTSVPVILWFGAAMGQWWSGLATARSRTVLTWVLLATGAVPLVARALHSPAPVYGGFGHNWRYPRTCAGTLIHALAPRGATLGIWGWACFLHVETGLPQASRDGTTLCSIRESPQREYYRAHYLADLRRSRPEFFVDAAGQGSFVFTDRTREGHEIFPELAAHLREHYTLLVDLQSERVYVRNDLSAARSLSRSQVWEILARGRSSERFLMSLPDSSLGELPQKNLGGRRVVMLLPPARIEWQLDAAVREVSLEFGYDPVAYEQGKSNGTDILLEVVGPNATIPVFQRFLNPAARPGDRGPQKARESLPPFEPGARLVLRTEPGPHDDAAWDWVYLASLRLHREADPDREP